MQGLASAHPGGRHGVRWQVETIRAASNTCAAARIPSPRCLAPRAGASSATTWLRQRSKTAAGRPSLGARLDPELGRKAGDTAKLLKAGLVAVRQEAAAMDSGPDGWRARRPMLPMRQRVPIRQAAVTAAALTLEEARQAYVQVNF